MKSLPGPSMHRSDARLAVVAIGGNSLIKDASHQTVEDQENALRATAGHLADMIASGWHLVITHGNGPQVGFILRRSEIAHRIEGMHEVPLDVCGADTQGAIGYEFQQALQNELYHRGIEQNVATLITQVLVDNTDPAFARPSKPIGGFMDAHEADRRSKELGWTVMEDAGRGWRRVVPSPKPREIVELDSVKSLISGGVIVITVGGGGIPVVDVGDGEYRGIAAVIDKDLAASLLAREICAELFLIATSVNRVALNYGKTGQQWIDRITLAEIKRYFTEGSHFAPGSMAPKIQAVIEYLDSGGKSALITSAENIMSALKNNTGTWIAR